MPLRKCVSMSTHGSSTPMVINGQATLGTPDVANLFAIETTNGWTNASCVEATGTEWVRIFVEWNYFSPNAPTAPHQTATKATGVSTLDATPAKGSGQSSPVAPTQPWGFPDILGGANRASVALCYKEVATNIAAARAAGAHVILATKFFPRWVSGPDLAANAEPIICSENNVMAPDNALAFYTGSTTPPNGSSFEATDYAFYFWLVNLINLYHPASPNRPAAAQGQYVDAIEVCNEPNFYYPAGTTSFAGPVQGGGESLAQSTALMMSTAQLTNAQMNASFQATLSGRGQASQFASLRLLGPALADSDSPTISHPFGPTGPKTLSSFAFADVLLQALAQQVDFDFADKLFGWSMHNYGDIESIGWKYSLLLDRYFKHAQSGAAKQLAAVQEISDALAPAVTPHFFGRHGQEFRTMLAKAKWRGWGDGSGPTIFMTEGGCRINRMPGYNSHGGVDTSADPDMNFTTGAVPAAFQRELQRVSLAGAAHTLSMRTSAYGEGIGMLTNFLFFDTCRTARFSTGLLDQYGPNQLPAQANVSLITYARPAFDVWRRFGFPKPSGTAKSAAAALSSGPAKSS